MKPIPFITLENAGQRIVKTDYWDTPHAQRGFLYLSWNAGCARVLIPDSQKSMLREVHSASEVLLSRGPWAEQGGRDAIEIMFEDGSDAPYTVILLAEQCDRLIPDEEQGGGFSVACWTRGGMKQRWQGKYRIASELPCLKEWRAH